MEYFFKIGVDCELLKKVVKRSGNLGSVKQYIIDKKLEEYYELVDCIEEDFIKEYTDADETLISLLEEERYNLDYETMVKMVGELKNPLHALTMLLNFWPAETSSLHDEMLIELTKRIKPGDEIGASYCLNIAREDERLLVPLVDNIVKDDVGIVYLYDSVRFGLKDALYKKYEFIREYEELKKR